MRNVENIKLQLRNCGRGRYKNLSYFFKISVIWYHKNISYEISIKYLFFPMKDLRANLIHSNLYNFFHSFFNRKIHVLAIFLYCFVWSNIFWKRVTKSSSMVKKSNLYLSLEKNFHIKLSKGRNSQRKHYAKHFLWNK